MARKAKKTTRKKRPVAKRKTSRKKAPEIPYSARILNCIPSSNQERDWTFENISAAGELTTTPIPRTCDLRENWWSVGDQGRTGSCVGWATADSVLRWHFVNTGKISTNEVLSTRFTWMASKETDEFVRRPTTFIESSGTSLKSALDVSRKFGSVYDSVLPFSSNDLYVGGANTFYIIASNLKISKYINLGRNLLEWRRWIAEHGPILTRLNVDQTWYDATSNSGVLDQYDFRTARGGHAIALVGYTDDMFIVRNSWGKTWGDKGFAYASNAYAAQAFTEAYGVET